MYWKYDGTPSLRFLWFSGRCANNIQTLDFNVRPGVTVDYSTPIVNDPNDIWDNAPGNVELQPGAGEDAVIEISFSGPRDIVSVMFSVTNVDSVVTRLFDGSDNMKYLDVVSIYITPRTFFLESILYKNKPVVELVIRLAFKYFPLMYPWFGVSLRDNRVCIPPMTLVFQMDIKTQTWTWAIKYQHVQQK